MKKLSVYLDTSVIGGYYDDEFKEHTRQLLRQIDRHMLIGVISDLTIREIKYAPYRVQAYFKKLLPALKLVRLNSSITRLAQHYISEGIITDRYGVDGLHIACATVHNVDVLVSWNFKHIVNLNKIVRFNAVNIVNGYKTLHIYSPREVKYYDEKEI